MSAPWTVPMIRELLQSRADAVEQAIVRLYDSQTASERVCHMTTDANGVGFNMIDADFLSSLAECIRYSDRPMGQRLTPRQLHHGRKRVTKYAGQLAVIANAPQWDDEENL